ncbi:MAG TPA: hypothetical protein VMX94_03500 [Armatimonadota bacterium]|nr:hypothetical protein [Armatimonadota bacterium]
MKLPKVGMASVVVTVVILLLILLSASEQAQNIEARSLAENAAEVRRQQQDTTIRHQTQAEYAALRDRWKEATKAQQEAIKEQVLGQMVDWSGWVHDVVELSAGQWVVWIDMDPPGDHFSTWDVEVPIPRDRRLMFRKDGPVRFRGVITNIGQGIFSDCSLEVKVAWN